MTISQLAVSQIRLKTSNLSYICNLLTIEDPDIKSLSVIFFRRHFKRQSNSIRVSSFEQSPARQPEHALVDKVFADQASG